MLRDTVTDSSFFFNLAQSILDNLQERRNLPLVLIFDQWIFDYILIFYFLFLLEI